MPKQCELFSASASSQLYCVAPQSTYTPSINVKPKEAKKVRQTHRTSRHLHTVQFDVKSNEMIFRINTFTFPHFHRIDRRQIELSISLLLSHHQNVVCSLFLHSIFRFHLILSHTINLCLTFQFSSKYTRSFDPILSFTCYIIIPRITMRLCCWCMH